jgi:hypothetical protein
MNPELIATIAGMRRSGLADARIKEVLLSTGWAEIEINDALKSVPLAAGDSFGEEPGKKPKNVAAAVLIFLIFAAIAAGILYGAYAGW